jgi:hypothetical protein
VALNLSLAITFDHSVGEAVDVRRSKGCMVVYLVKVFEVVENLLNGMSTCCFGVLASVLETPTATGV